MTIYPPELVQRNATFAAGGAFQGLPFPTNPALRVIGCVDSRVDPSDVLGLKLGEAVVMRNIGGRVTPEVLRSWALLSRLGSGRSSGGHLAILHHTNCGIRRLADYPDQLAAFFEIPVAELAGKAVDDPYAAVRIDVGIARHRLPGLLVSGLVYDVDTGLIDVVVPTTTAHRTGNHVAEQDALCGLGAIRVAQGRHESAVRYFERALGMARRTGNTYGQFEAHQALGRAPRGGRLRRLTAPPRDRTVPGRRPPPAHRPGTRPRGTRPLAPGTASPS